jgi:asparagine synthase (glutamine-hydrolysing)
MCGILGFSGIFDHSSFKAGLNEIAHRGPDDSGVFVDEKDNITLGHVRLTILELSKLGHQPMSNDNGQVILIFNGEIYNFRELRNELEKKGHRFRGRSDTEVVLRLYLAEGEDMLAKLNGIFAFAVWDKRNQSLFIARDALGVKPLYYAQIAEGFAFSSEIKGLMKLVPGVCELDTVALHRYLSFLYCPGSRTPMRKTRKVKPGHAMIVRKGQIIKTWQWYQLPVFHSAVSQIKKIDVIQGTEKALRSAVHRQLISDVPVGAFLSGGLDSSAVVAMAREQNQNINCFTIDSGGSEEGMTDDLPYARRVAKHLGVPLEVVKIDSGCMATDLEKMIYQLDEPLADPAPLNVLYISRLAREQGIKVLLSGAGGDDIFTGYRRHFALNFENSWSWLPRGFRDGLDTLTGQLDQRKPLFRKMSKLFSGAALEGDVRIVNYFIWAKESQLMSLYSPDFRASIVHGAGVKPMLNFLSHLPDSTPRLERMLALEKRFFLTDHNLTYTDKMSMAAGVEVRVPFLDLELVKFAACIPPHFKQRGRTGKWVLKRAMEKYLPKDVIYRPKSGFGAPIRHWMRYELREMLSDLLSEASLRKRGLFDSYAVQRLIKQNDLGEVDASYTLLSLLCIEIWCRQYIDKPL